MVTKEERLLIHGINFDRDHQMNYWVKPSYSNFLELMAVNSELVDAADREMISRSATGCPKIEDRMKDCDGNHPTIEKLVMLQQLKLKPPTRSGKNAGKTRAGTEPWDFNWEIIEVLDGFTAKTVSANGKEISTVNVSDMAVDKINQECAINDRKALELSVAFGRTMDAETNLLRDDECLKIGLAWADALNERVIARHGVATIPDQSPLVKHALDTGAVVTAVRDGEPAEEVMPTFHRLTELMAFGEKRNWDGEKITALLGGEPSSSWCAKKGNSIGKLVKMLWDNPDFDFGGE